MPKGRTGYEILKQLWTGKLPVEKQFTNPLDAKIGSHARIDRLEGFDSQLFTVSEIWAWDRRINGNTHALTDYILESDGTRIVLRVVPKISRGKNDEPELILMTQYWPDNMSGPYPWGNESPFVLDGLMDPTGEFVRFKGEPHEERYFRDLNNIVADVSIITDVNRDGVVEMDEVKKEQFSLWTFRRVTTDEANQEFVQHLHVQLSGLYDADTKKVSGGDKDILILRGELVSPFKIMLY